MVTLIVILFVALVGVAAAYRVRRVRVVKRFRQLYSKQGKDLLVVYTDSPHWQPRIETEWLVRWGERAVTFNRSRQWPDDRPEIALWKVFKGAREHTPVAIVVPARGKVQVIPFFLAFRDFKHGKDERLLAAEAKLSAALAESARVGA